MNLFFSGSLSQEEQNAFLDMQLGIYNDLIQELKNNYKERWGILRSEAYVKLLEDIILICI